MQISKDLCEFVGAVIGDGNLWTDGSRYRIALTGDPKLDLSYFSYMRKLSYGLFSKEPYRFRVRYGGLRFILQSKDAFNVFLKLEISRGKKARNIIIPRAIMKKGWGYTKYVIRGIFDTDGTLFFSKKTYPKPIYPTLEICTYSRNLALQLSTVLKNRGFRVRLRGNLSRSKGYYVSLYGKEMLNKWINEIGFSNERHINKLARKNPNYTPQ